MATAQRMSKASRLVRAEKQDGGYFGADNPFAGEPPDFLKNEAKVICGVCQQPTGKPRYVGIRDGTVTVCPDCIHAGPTRCAQLVLDHADDALFLGRALLALDTWDHWH